VLKLKTEIGCRSLNNEYWFSIAVLTYNVLRGTWNHSPVLSMCQLDTHSDLPLPTIVFCLSSCQILAAKHFQVPPAKIWNSLPDYVVSAASVDSFRHQLQKFSIPAVRPLLAVAL